MLLSQISIIGKYIYIIYILKFFSLLKYCSFSLGLIGTI